MKSLAFTLVFSLAILNVASLADATHNSNRLVKKRSPAHVRRQGGPGGLGVIGAAPSPSVVSQEPSSSAPATTTTPTTTAPTTTVTSQTATTSTTTQRGIVGGVINTLLPPDTTTTTSSITTTTSSQPTTTTPTTTSSSIIETPTIQSTTEAQILSTPPPVVAPPAFSTTFQTVTGPASAQESEPAPPPTGATSRLTRNTIIIIVAIAGSIGVVALIWTIIRKWKFSPSSSFEERMNPIDWQPTPEDGIVPHRARPTSHGSFGSADYHNRSQHGHDLVADLPPHDLLSTSHQVGGGYTDMHRGPSPQPPMSEGVRRGPSLNHGTPYDRYQDAYDYNGTGQQRSYY